MSYVEPRYSWTSEEIAAELRRERMKEFKQRRRTEKLEDFSNEIKELSTETIVVSPSEFLKELKGIT